MFVGSGASWSQQLKLTASDGAANDYFGFSAALSGDTALIGARGDDVGGTLDQGSAWVFIAPPIAVFRDPAGSVRLIKRGELTTYYAGGIFASDPAADWNATGDTLAVARDNWGSLWANQFTDSTSTWGA